MSTPRKRRTNSRALRDQAEAALRRAPRESAGLPDRETGHLVHELQVHQEELEIQNEELRTAQNELELSRDRYAELYDFAPVGYLTLDTGAVIRECNLTACRMLGVERQKLVRAEFQRFIADGSQDDFYLHRQKVLAADEHRTCELLLRRADGVSFPVSLESAAMPGPDRPRMFLVAISDITTQRRTFEALQRSEKALSTFFAEAPIGLLIVDPRGNIQRANHAACELLAGGSGELSGRNVAAFHLDEELAANLLERLAARQTVVNQRVRFRSADRSVKHVLIDANGLWEEDRLVHSRWFIRDITGRVELEREVLTISDKERQRFAHDLHDDLCQRLAGIEFLSQTLVADLAGVSRTAAARAKKIARMVRVSIEHGRDLARGLSPLALGNRGLAQALRELAVRTGKLFGRECLFQCPKPVVVSEPDTAIHLYRIAQEAVNNAIKHGKARRIEIGLTRTADTIMVAIRDDGVGIASSSGKGMGIRVMQYRAGVIGGTLAVQRRANRGTEVVCTVREQRLSRPNA